MTAKSLSNVSTNSCNWRAHIQKNDSLQAWDGKAWRTATVYGLNQNHGIDEVDVYFNKAPSGQITYNRGSNCIRPTIGFLRRKIMVPQAQQIALLDADIKNLRNDAVEDHKEINRLNHENKFLKQQLSEMSVNQNNLRQQVQALQHELRRIHDHQAAEQASSNVVESPKVQVVEQDVSPKASAQSPPQPVSPAHDQEQNSPKSTSSSPKVLKPPITSYDRIRKKYGNQNKLDEIDESSELKHRHQPDGETQSVVKQTYGAFKLKVKQQGNGTKDEQALQPEEDEDMKLEELQTTPGNQAVSSSQEQDKTGNPYDEEDDDDDDIGDDDDSNMTDID